MTIETLRPRFAPLRMTSALALLTATLALSACSGEESADSFAPPTPDTTVAGDYEIFKDIPSAVDTDGGPTLPPPPTDCTVDGDCDDQNPCTGGFCVSGECNYLFLNGAACDDADLCTNNDKCLDGDCIGDEITCADGNNCTADKCKEGDCVHKPESTPECKLTVELTTPARGASILSDNAVDVLGTAFSPAGALQLVTVNGFPVTTNAAGNFNHTIIAVPGINMIEVVATDIYERADKSVRAFLFMEDVNPAGNDQNVKLIPNSARAYLRADVWDDDDLSDFDDLATIAFEVVNHLDLEALIPSPLFAEGDAPGFAWCEWDIEVSQVDYKLTDVDMKPTAGALLLSANFTDLKAHFSAVASWCPDAVGWVYADEINIFAKLPVSVINGELIIDVTNIDVQIVGVTVDVQQGFASLFDWLFNWFSESFVEIITDKLETWIPDQLVPKLVSMLNSLLMQDLVIEIPAIPGTGGPLPMVFKTQPVNADLTNAGAAFGVSIGVGTQKKNDHPAPGTIRRGDCGGTETGEFYLPKEEAVEGAVGEDLINQMLFAVWQGGHMNVTLDDDIVGQFVEGFGVTEVNVTIDPFLPPVFTSCTPEKDAEVQLGDLHTVVSFKLGGDAGNIDLYATAAVEVDIDVNPAYPVNELTLKVGNVTAMGIDVVSSGGIVEGSEALVEQLLTEIIVNVLIKNYLGELLAAYPIPTIDIGKFVPDMPPGSKVKFNIKSVTHDHGFVLATGKPK